MAKTSLPKHELERAVLAEIRRSFGGAEILAVEVDYCADLDAGSNWRIAATSRRASSIDNATEDDRFHTASAILAAYEKLGSLFNLRTHS
ncbi:hypothetical protein [Tardiphaga sp.]|uniref:hypothetical protein n=1 Tax=Tardiphaga sp. TaxID=1926292 RepID=UPI0026223F2A|nr:hypothetical protein [Tardiphaga sp.]MDB5617066.1 hypothetical protein [Tardiphaga sp.]